MRWSARLLVSTILAAAVAAGVTVADESWPRIPIRFHGQSRYGNQPNQGMVAWYAHGTSIPPRLANDFACHLVGGLGGRTFQATHYDPLCLTMRGDGEAAFVCGLDVADSEVTIPTEPAVVVSWRVATPDGSPLSPLYPRGRSPAPSCGWTGLLLHGALHVHPMHGDLSADGLVSMNVPLSVARDPRTEVFVLAAGWPALRVPLPTAAEGGGPFVFTLSPGRRIHATIAVPEEQNGVDLVIPPAKDRRLVLLGKGGQFDQRVPEGTTRIVLLGGSSAATVIELPAGTGDVNLGTIGLRPGVPVRGTVKWRRGSPVQNATVAAYDAEGICVAWTSTFSNSGSFRLPSVGPGPHRLRVVGSPTRDVMMSRDVSLEGVVAGGPDIDFVFPPGITLSFADEAGKPVALQTVTVGLTPEGGAAGEPRQLWARSPEQPVTSALLDAPGPGLVHVAVRAPGFRPATVDVTVDATGAGKATVVLRPR